MLLVARQLLVMTILSGCRDDLQICFPAKTCLAWFLPCPFCPLFPQSDLEPANIVPLGLQANCRVGLHLNELGYTSANISLVQELNIGQSGTGPGFNPWAGLQACLLASSRWEPTLHSRPSPSEARLGCKPHILPRQPCFCSTSPRLSF